MTGRSTWILAGAGLTAGTLAASYPLWRGWCLTWGATADEAESPMKGDELLPDADLVTTRAIAIDAKPARVWPWLVQMGSGRAGTYSYDWVENLFGLDMHSAQVILPQFQNVKEGDEFPLRSVTMRVEALEADQLLAIQVPAWNWVRIFCLIPDGGMTRLLLRNRIAYPGMGRVTQWRHRAFCEPAGLLMESKMLHGIKVRAEGDPGQAWSNWDYGDALAC
ncbi:MAG: hypothetical protein LBV34_00125 [Nocardiopsaceae bacterium]|jgi:hypothetical protein|nr:hypothetical protein [Nocardiopsaceae bacterium]